MAKVGEFADQEVGSGALGATIGKSAQWIRTLTKNGVLTKTSAGKYVLGQSVQSYIEHVQGAPEDKEGQSKSEIDRQIAEIKRDEARIRLQERRGEVHYSNDVRAIMADSIATTRQKFLNLPTRLAPKLAGEAPAVIEKMLAAEISAVLLALTEYDPALFLAKGGEDDEEEEPSDSDAETI